MTWVSSTGERMSSSPFDYSTVPTYNKTVDQLKSQGYVDASGNLTAEHNAATQHWGAPWRMPTDAEHVALYNNCDWTWTRQNGVNGYAVKGRGAYSAYSIFLPAAGYGNDTNFFLAGSNGDYWSSTPYSDSLDACYLDFYSRYIDPYNVLNRHGGFSVRAVRGFTQPTSFPSISAFTAAGREPIDGKIDLNLLITVSEWPTNAVVLSFGAVDNAGRTNLTVRTLAYENGASSTIVSAGVYRVVWNAAADLGRVVLSNVTITATLAEVLDDGTIASALEASAWAFTNDSSAPWSVDATDKAVGRSSVRSGAISDNGVTKLSTTVTGAGTLGFRWKIDSEPGYDYLHLYVDGTEVHNNKSVNQTWETKSYVISGSGTHTVEWRYTKDGSVSNGRDCGWVDGIMWNGAHPLVTGEGRRASRETSAIIDTCVPLPDPGEHAYVQLWENGPYWATTNIGADKPEDYGYYFWWGDTVGYQAETNAATWMGGYYWSGVTWVSSTGERMSSSPFDESTVPTYDKSVDQLKSQGYVDASGNLTAEHDAATQHWGAPWRMPTDAEFGALLSNCDSKWTTRNGVYGRVFMGRGSFAGNNIFVPAAGHGNGSSLYYPGSDGIYWSSTPDSLDSGRAWNLDFDSGYAYRINCIRYNGFAVRPVREFAAPEPQPSAFPRISAFTAAGREPVDGKIDLNLTIAAGEWPTNAVALSFGAVDNAGGTNLTVRTLAYGNGASSTIVSAGVYRVVWNAAADLGRVVLSNVTLKATLAEVLDDGTIASALEASAWTFTNDSSAPWSVDATDKAVGASSVRSGAIVDKGVTKLSTTVTGAGTLGFRWKIDSEFDYDYLHLYVDGSEVLNNKSVSRTWETKFYAISGTGTHTVEWRYTKDGSDSDGRDCGWVDGITWNGAHPLVTGEGRRASRETSAIIDTCVPLPDFGEHDAIQLWENGPYWATTNIGADKPEDYGYYFWWGDTVGYKRNAANDCWVASDGSGNQHRFYDSNTPTYHKTVDELKVLGYVDASGKLTAEHDAATQHWGAPWRMPTDAEFGALLSNCDSKWTTRNGVYGRVFKGRGAFAENNIFVPAAGRGHGSDLNDPGSGGYYWSSTPDSVDSYIACCLYFNSGYAFRNYNFRYYGFAVRPVREFAAPEPQPSAFPRISAFTAAGREPVDGMIDLNLTIAADVWPTNAVVLSFGAVDNAGGTNLMVQALAYENGASSTIVSAGVYRVVWIAAADLGRVVLSNVTLKATLAEVLDDGTIASALEASAWTFTNDSSAPWSVDATDKAVGASSVRSGAIGDNGVTKLSTTVTGVGTLGFRWKIDSESGYDYLHLYVDGSEVFNNKSVNQTWETKSYAISGSGTHTVEWRYYMKDGSDSDGRDCGWVDGITWNGAHPLVTGEGRRASRETSAIIDTCVPLPDFGEHDAVQLWENGPYWATTNIGADKPEDYGYYFWWGDTVGYKRNAANDGWVASDGSGNQHRFYDSNTPTYNKTVDQLKSQGYVDASGNLTAEHDAATQHWGAGWRMPTDAEHVALYNNCDWTWTRQNGVNGYAVKGRGAYSAYSIFLPAAGFGYDTLFYDAGSDGYYWSSTPDSDSDYAWYLCFYSGGIYPGSVYYRYFGFSVRAVRGFTQPTSFPRISAFTAAGREPIDGMIDLNLTIAASEWPTNAVVLSFGAVDNAGGTNLMVQALVYENGASSTIVSAGVYRVVWNAVADLGRVVLSNVTITATLAENGGSGRTASREIAAVIDTRNDPLVPSEHDAIQLWENGPYWATTNIGAEKPEDYGYYFWWGDTVGYQAETNAATWMGGGYWSGVTWVSSTGERMSSSPFSSSTCPTYNKTVDKLKGLGYVDASGNLTAEHDAATQHWGAGWRMPTHAEHVALYNNCDWKWTRQNGVDGYAVKGRGAYSAYSIFLPAAGYGLDTNFYFVGSYGYYWSSTPDSHSYSAWYLDFFSSYIYPDNVGSRDFGFSVRAVRGFTQQ